MRSQDSVPAVAESDATGETAEIFADIRQVLGSGVVNLIWPNLATMPGALSWVWSSVRPLYLGPGPFHAEMLLNELVLPDIPPYSGYILKSAGISGADLTQIQDVLASYHHTNALALVILSAMLSYQTPSGYNTIQHTGTAASPPRGIMPVLPVMSELAPETASLVEELNGFGEDTDATLIASMYRHLAHWPTYLALTRDKLAPLEHSGEIRELVQVARLRAHAHGRILAARLETGAPPETASEALAACRRFVEHPIARMTCIRAIMRNATVANF